MPKPKITVAIVTTYPPGQGSLNEYAYHFVRCLRQKQEVREIILLTDSLPEGRSYPLMGAVDAVPIRIVPCWRFGAWTNPLRILAAAWKVRPDIVLFNLQFATFGDRKIPAALGLLTPVCARVLGFPSVVLLHHLMEKIDLKSAGFGSRIEQVIRFFGTMLTRCLLMTNLVVLTMPQYVEFLARKYGVNNVVLAPHGAFVETPSAIHAPSTNAEDKHVLLTFGKFGTYKRVEQLLDAFVLLQTQQRPALELVIAGTDSPNAPGYLDAMRRRYAAVPNVTFTGYVPEAQVASVFNAATIVVFPYISTTGSSGVLHQAGEYGKAVVLPHIGDFAEVIAEEGYRGGFFEVGSVQSLAGAIAALLDNPQERAVMGQHNYSAAHSLPISDVVDWYLVHFEYLLDQRQRRKAHASTRISAKHGYSSRAHWTV